MVLDFMIKTWRGCIERWSGNEGPRVRGEESSLVRGEKSPRVQSILTADQRQSNIVNI